METELDKLVREINQAYAQYMRGQNPDIPADCKGMTTNYAETENIILSLVDDYKKEI